MGATGSAVKDVDEADQQTETEITATYIQERAGDVIERAIAGECFKVTRYGSTRVYVISAREYDRLREIERSHSTNRIGQKHSPR